MEKLFLASALVIGLATPAFADTYRHSRADDSQTEPYRLVRSDYSAEARASSEQYRDDVVSTLRFAMRHIDRNGDGLIDRNEHAVFRGTGFSIADRDNDGKLTFDELVDHSVANEQELTSIVRAKNDPNFPNYQ